MHSAQWVGLIASVAHLAVAFLVILRRAKSPLVLPLSLLCLDMFAWNAADLAFQLSRRVLFHRIDILLSPFTAALAVHVVIVFVGKLRALRGVLVGIYLLFAAAAVASLAGLRASLIVPICVVPPALFAVYLLARHLRRASDLAERTRTRLMITGFVIGAVLGPAEYVHGLPVPIGAPGLVVSTAIVGLVAVRFRLLDRELSSGVVLYALVLSLVSILAGVVVFRALGGGLPVIAIGTTVVTVALLLATRGLVAAYGAERARATQLATLGRFSGQMAHDLRNPLAALKGSIEYLVEERHGGKPIGDYQRFLGLMVDQVERLDRVVDRYQRVSRIEPVLAKVDVNETVRAALALQPFVSREVRVETALAEGLPPCALDVDLFTNALENLVRNAMEAMPRGGAIVVRTETITGTIAPSIVVSVADEGGGMDARAAERAFDDFFTTKAAGSGLGLAFVRRVALAHGGEVSMTTDVGRGTTVRLHLPLEA